MGFRRDGDLYLLALDADEAQALGLVIAQVAGLIQADRQGSAAEEPEPVGNSEDAAISSAYLAQLTGLSSTENRPTDPALERLFPDGYRDDAEAAAELRRLTQASLRDQKVGNAAAVLDALPLEGGEVRLDSEGAESWLLAMNDARLVVGTRLDLTDDTDLVEELDEAVLRDPTAPRVLAISVYQFLTYLTESLVEAMDPEYGF